MKKNKKTLKLFSLCFLLSVICFFSCDQPFRAGLGGIIDLQDPTIVLVSPIAGSYIRGTVPFTGRASDDYKLDTVWFNLANYQDVVLSDYKKQKFGDDIFYLMTNTAGDSRNITWKFEINTLLMADAVDEDGNPVFEADGTRKKERVFSDGHLMIRLMAIDHATKSVITDKIVFNIKNDIPTITVDAPPIQAGTADGELGGDHLNYNFLTVKPTMFKRSVEPKSDLQGMISDHQGIYRKEHWKKAVIAEDGDPIFDDNGNPILDSENKIKVDKDGNPKTPKIVNGKEATVELFPPQIRFWEVYFDDIWPTDKSGYPVDRAYKAGEIPTLEQEPWMNFKEVGSIIDTGVNNVAFFYSVPDASGHYYAFQVRAQSTDSRQSSAEYPRDYIDFEGKSDAFINENSYVLILVSEFQEDPILTLYNLEDIWGKDGFKGRVGDVATYNDLPELVEPDKSDGNHPYVNENVVRKNGAFTLRMKASHSGGIASAKAYWEKSDKSQKGRLIWDPAKLPYAGWPGAIPSKSAHYSTWGLNEPDGDTRVRSFVFTYSDLNPDGATADTALYDRLPNETEFLNNVMGDIRNMSKVQRYAGGQFNTDGKAYALHELPEDMGNWRDVYKLDEGKYYIYIYTTSNSGAPSPKPYRVELSIDRKKPVIELNYIDGSAGEKKNEKGERENTVNGVIQPWFLFSDSRPTDTGFRDGTADYFLRPGSTNSFLPEQAYILIPKADEDLMAVYLAEHPWPEFPNMPGGAPVLKTKDGRQVTVSKHGPIIDTACRFRTSPIYHIPPLPGPNPDMVDRYLDDGNYRMYVFARDNAFNVGSVSYPIIVDRETDKPTFDFSIGSTNTGVTEPDSAYDYKGSKYNAALPYEKSFITANGSRNIFTANSGIQVRIKDDDSLDLGVKDGASSNIKVTFIGSRPVEDSVTKEWVVEPYSDILTDGYLMPLGDTEVKQAFPPAGESGERVYVKDVRGNITYKMLLDLLKSKTKYNDLFPADPAKKAEISTIPDGLYRVGISICDYSPAKLTMAAPFTSTPDTKSADIVTVDDMPVPIPAVVPAPNPPLKQEYTKYFWIAVDNYYPVINITEGGDGGIIMPNEQKVLKGTVSDENGPITLVNWKVKNGNTVESEMGKTPLKTDSPRIEITPLAPQNPLYDKGKWNYDFSYKLSMNGRANGTYDFEITFQDRFGKPTTVSLRYSVDNDPPKLSLIKRIETFSRDFADVDLKDYVQLDKTEDGIRNNKERLSVKVVNFSINATDSNGIEGVHWWLLPADTGSRKTTGAGDTGAFDTSGQVLDYNAFPARLPTFNIPGVYYGNTVHPDGFTKGVYGVVDVDNRRFTIAFDSRKLPSPNGEYRLHIIAKDKAGNYSRVTEDANKNPTSNLFQEVFFLQIEDKPYLDNGISPGEALPNTQFKWPQENGKDKEMPVLGGAPVIRGTVWENNGFFGDGQQNSFWPADKTKPGSITVWFSATGAELPTTWEADVIAGNDITSPDGTKYVKKNIPNDIPAGAKTGLGMQIRNISMAIELPTLFPDEFKNITDGKKRYIIKATDSPVNKLKEQTYPGSYNTLDGNALKMGVGLTNADDEGIREYNYRQYAFVYDAVPPKVVIDTPAKKPVQTYGRTFATTFILGGSISDANLEKTPATPASPAGDYYFDYYLNSDPKKTFSLKPRTGVDLSNPILVDVSGVPLAGQPAIPAPPADSAIVSGQHIYAITKDTNGKVTVYFRIKTSDLANNTNGIIPASTFTALPEGQHTLTLWAADKSGKEGVDFVDFIKDTEAPKIAFTNLAAENKPYDSTNASKVDKANASGGVVGWWNKDRAARQTLLFGSTLPLTTIYYNTGVPELRGTISDLVSNIDLSVINSSPNTNTLTGHDGTTVIKAEDVGTGDINTSASKFRYWIDNEYQLTNGSPTTTGRYLAVIDGAGTKNVRWTINLTNDGTAKGTPLYDGVHTIVLTAADKAGEEIPDAQRYMIAFRIDSKPPRSKVTVSGASSSVVYGNVAYQNPGSTSMFTLTVTGDDANLKEVKLRIKNTTTGVEEPEVVFSTSGAGWTYYPSGSPAPLNPALPSPFPLDPPPVVPLTEDYILFNRTYDVLKTLFTKSGKYDVIVAAYDHAKNKSEDFVFQFTYDMDKPAIEFTNPSDDNKNAGATLKPEDFIDLATLAGKNKINRLTSQNLRIQGSVKDTFSAIRQVQSRVERWNWLTGAWVETEDWKNIQEYSTNTQTSVSWTKNLLGQNNVSGQTPVDLDVRTVDSKNPTGEGLYRIQVRAKDASIITIPPGTNDWNTTTGQGNPIVSDYQYFYFDRTNPTLEITSINGSTTSMDTYYSNPGKFTFKGMVTDNNRFAKVEVKFEVTGKDPIIKDATLTRLVAGDPGFTNAADNPARTINAGGVTQNWEAVFDNAGSYPDGKYKVTVTVYDMTGKSTSQTKSFILDSTPPTVKFTLPAKVQNKGYGDDSENKKPTPAATANGFASVIVPGGPTAVITGETGDKPGVGGEPGSQSGIDQMWFHLGFIDGATYNAANPFPSKDAIKDWESTMIERHSGLSAAAVAALTVKQRNTWMDTIAEYRAQGATEAARNGDTKGNAWFKLGGTRKPTGFVINNPNIYDWRMEIPDKLDAAPMPATDPNYEDHYDTMVDGKRLSAGGVQIEGLKLYGGTITVKGRTYTVGDTAARQMVRAIAGQAGGVYRLPLWIRLTDVAGNVEYYCHDIWIDTNGSIPSTSIESPSNGTQYNARGGTISVDGVARSNTSVYDVIFRVFADAVPDTNLDGIQTNGRPTNTNKTIGGNGSLSNRPDPATNNPVRITGYDPAEAGTVAKLPADAYYQTAWQKANLTLKGGSGEPIIPWSIMLNSEDQIKDLISTKGFASAGTTKDMIRVWLEVFVFNGEGSPIRSSIYPNDNLGTASYSYTGANGGHLYGTSDTTGGNPGPRPYVRAFYIRTGAAAITHPNVGTWTSDYKAPTPVPTPAPFARANFTWNGEDAGKQGGGGYGGAGTETRSNKFAFSATLDPNPSGTSGSGLGEVAYRIKLDGGSYGAWTTVWKTGDTAITAAAPYNKDGVRISVRDTSGNRTRYYFDYAINSKSAAPPAESGTIFAPVNGGNWANTGGTITVQVRMKDNSPQPNEAEQTIQVAVDNFAPLTDLNYRTNPKVAGTNVNFMGRVYDYATAPPMNTEYTPRKLERVSVWFTKGAGANLRYVNMNQKNTTVANLPSTRTINAAPVNTRTADIAGGGASDAVTGITLTSQGGAVGSITYPGLGAQQAYNADYVRDITQATGQPVNKMLWSPVNSAVYDVRWQLTLDSTLLPDGDLTLHYIVVDAAGNASYYTQTGISVRNNYPEITRVTLYTNNDGQGAAYTADAVQAYDLNNYRSKMFANFTDSEDHDTKAKTTGYLNSGFISKNSYLGFKVETSKGNRPLNFRLQHVKRERKVLDSTTLNQMVTDRTTGSATTINLYTIAWHGNYTPQRWKALGVPIDNNPNPTLGTHFVFNPVNITDPTKPFAVADAVGTAEVWKYTAVVTRTDIINPTVAGQAQDADPFVYGPNADFEFNGGTHFNPTAANRINEYYGSHPDAGAGDLNEDNPDDTAFFLIRVWDTVNSTGSPAETWVNDQLFDALVVGMNVYQTDKNAPLARLYDLNPYTETAVIENNKPQTIKDAANPTAIGSNIVRGGLYNDGSAQKLVRSGFIDPRSGSTALNPKNGVYYKEATWTDSQLINGVAFSDYPLKVASDVATGTAPNPERDKVSGKVILRGFAWDDQLIDEIRISINGGAANTILKLTSGKMAATGAGIRDSQPVAFAEETLHWKTGHSVEWAYIWDTALAPINNAPATNVQIQVSVKDVKSSPGTSANYTLTDETADPATSKKFHNTVNVDVVPYITGFERQTPDSLTKRSLQGWYSFYRGEQGVKVNGYNFGTGAAAITIGGSNMTNTGTATATQRIFNIPDNTSVNSGAINVTFGTSDAAYNNNSSTTGKSWNKEANTYTPGSDLWINKHYAHIWRTVEAEGSATTAGTIFATGQTTAGLDSPGMALQYTGGDAGRLHGSWTTYGRESLFYAQNSSVKPTVHNNADITANNGFGGESRGTGNFGRPGSLLLVKSGEPYSASDIDYYNGANNNDYFNNTSVVAAYQRDGGPWLILKPRLTSIVFHNNNNANGDGGGTDGGYSITREQNPVSTYRWTNTRIKKTAVSTADNNPGNVFVTAYDSTYKRLFFKTVSGTIATSAGGQNNNGGTDYFLDGGGTLSSGVGYGTIGAATGGAGNWAALDYTSQGYPVVAYFDEQHQTLRLAYANSATPAANNWTVRYVLASSSPLYLGSGSYVSMAIDRANSNKIHLAFYNSNNKAVVYATADSPSGTFTASVIDPVVEGGQWTDISVDSSGNPWIVYADSARKGNKNGARIAYKGAFTRELKDPVSGTAITGWEALTMPSNYEVKDDRLNIAAWPPTGYSGSAANCPIGDWNAAVGYASDLFRVGYFFKPAVPTGF